jgi:HSP20 family molecular chaperone IbpA
MRDLIKWKPRKLDNWFDTNFFNDPFGGLFRDFQTVFTDGIVTYLDDDKNFVIELEVPGFNKDNIDVELAGGILTVNGKREVKTECYVGHKEINKRYQVGDFQDAVAIVEDGILKITIKTPTTETKKIEVK